MLGEFAGESEIEKYMYIFAQYILNHLSGSKKIGFEIQRNLHKYCTCFMDLKACLHIA